MRCGCPHCDAFMIQGGAAEVCVCPECGYRCNACLGTGTAITREELAKLRGTEWFSPSFLGDGEENKPEEAYTTKEECRGVQKGS
jgi:hypothetical protein